MDAVTADRLRRLTSAAEAARHAWDDAREARDAEFERADLDGHSVRAIARASGMSPANVNRIVVERTAARQARTRAAVGL